MKYRNLIIVCLFLIASLFVGSAQAQNNASAYNPCDHLAEKYHQLDAGQYQGLVDSCNSKAPQSNVDKVQQAASTAQSVAVVAKGVGEGVGEAAKGVGGAISDLAKNLGVTMNDFLHSPAGVLLAFVFVMKVIGSKLLVIPFILTVISIWSFMLMRLSRDDVQYEFVPVLWGAFKYRRVVSFRRDLSEWLAGYGILSGIGVGLLCLIVALNV
jgi:hypothetical protein